MIARILSRLPLCSPDRRPAAGAGVAAMCLWNSPAAADFRLCNNTSSRVGIALGYKDAEGWTTEGWWNISSRLARRCCAGRWSPVTTTSTRSIMTAAANGRARPSCARVTRNSPSRHRELPGARLRPHRLFRGRYRRAAGLDRPTDRSQRTAGTKGAGNAGRGRPGSPGAIPGMPNPPGATPPGTSGLPPAAAPGSKT